MPSSGGFKAPQTEAFWSSQPSGSKRSSWPASCLAVEDWKNGTNPPYKVHTPYVHLILIAMLLWVPFHSDAGLSQVTFLANRMLANMMQMKIWKVLGKWGLSSFAVLEILDVKIFGLPS